MKSLNLRTLAIFGLVAGMFCFLSFAAGAATTPVHCESDATALQSAIDAAGGGDTLTVTGVCAQNVVIYRGLTLNGGGTITTTAAEISATDNTQPAVMVGATGVTINGFTIQGGKHGVTIQNGASANIVNSIIQNNTKTGILVREGASAHIGFYHNTDATTPGNLIQNNPQGIVVMSGASARIAGNTISKNTGNGIMVDRVSQADIAGNQISDNSSNGIAVSGNSGVNLGMDNKAGTPFDLPNYTDGTKKNLGAGIACTLGGYVAGYKGFVTGAKGALTMDASCVNGTQASPYTVVGTWTVVATPSDPTTPTRVTMRADGTGTALVGNVNRPFTWTLLGDQLTIKTGVKVNKGPVTFQDVKAATWVFGSGATTWVLTKP
jgi:hypothetical protein